MGRADTTSYRPATGREVQAGDHLPTREVLDWVKSEAWRRAGLKAFGLGWPVGEAGFGVLRLAPAVALIALTKLCPQVPLWRAGRCLGLDDGEVTELWNRALSAGPWAAEQAAEIFNLLRGGAPEGEGA